MNKKLLAKSSDKQEVYGRRIQGQVIQEVTQKLTKHIIEKSRANLNWIWWEVSKKDFQSMCQKENGKYRSAAEGGKDPRKTRQAWKDRSLDDWIRWSSSDLGHSMILWLAMIDLQRTDRKPTSSLATTHCCGNRLPLPKAYTKYKLILRCQKAEIKNCFQKHSKEWYVFTWLLMAYNFIQH